MADLKISQFADGGAIQTGDEIATNRSGINTKVFVGSAASLDAGSGVGDVITWQDDGGGNPQYPAADGSQITGVETSADLISYTPSSGSSITADNVQDAIDELESDLSNLGGVVLVTTNDTTPGVLNDKLIDGTGLTKTVNNPAGNETLELEVDFTEVATAAQGAKADTAVQPGDAFSAPLFHVRDEKAAGTAAGSFNSGSWVTRVLNTVVTNDISGSSLSSNQITLPSGTYDLEGNAPAGIVNRNQLRFQNITDSTTTLIGQSALFTVADNGRGPAFISGRFTIADTKTFELQHQCQTTRATDGLGIEANLGLTEIYADLKIRKVG